MYNEKIEKLEDETSAYVYICSCSRVQYIHISAMIWAGLY